MNFKTMSPLTILIIIVVVLVGTVGVIYGLGALSEIPGNGEVKTPASIVSDPIDLAWGEITQGTTQTITVELSNNGGTDAEGLLITNNWDIGSGSGLTLNFPGTVSIPATEKRSITFTLTATSAATPGPFSHTVTISD